VVLEAFGGAKGFGLGLMVEILAGALTGAGVSTEVRSMYRDFEHGGNNGHLVITLDIGQWMSLPAFHDRMERLLCAAESSGESASHRVRLPGQARWDAVALTQSEGLRISARVAETLDTLASRLGIATPW
jgi:LDH2 family malate/lactate/ureidoglycolate dehydrogenase